MQITSITSNLSKLLFSVIVLSFISGCSKNNVDKIPVLLNNYTISSPGLYPESVDYDNKNQRFIIGSFNEGNVYILHPDNGKLQLFITDTNIISVTGVDTDEAHNRLIVVSGGFGISKRSGANNSTAGTNGYLGIYNLTNGKLIKGINLRPYAAYLYFYPNGVTADKDGNIYITDSFSPCIYKVDNAYETSYLVNDPGVFAYSKSFIGLNGITYSEDGYLIISESYGNRLCKITLQDPIRISEIKVPDTYTGTPDGLVLTSDNKLVVVDNGSGSSSGNGNVHILVSEDGWATAHSIKDVEIGSPAYPTGCTLTNDSSIYVISSYLGKLMMGDKNQSQFTLSNILKN